MTLPSPIVSGLIRAIPLAFALSSMAAGAGLAQTRAELRWGVGMEIASLDPVYQTNNWEYVATANIYDGLVWPDEKKGVAPWIADSWTISDDGKTYVFTLKTNVPFHDGGLLTAEDVAFSMKRMLDLAGPAASNFRSVDPDGIRVIDAKTVSFSLKEPNSAFLKALLTFKIVSKKIVLANKAEGKFGEFGDYGVKHLRTADAGSGSGRRGQRASSSRSRTGATAGSC